MKPTFRQLEALYHVTLHEGIASAARSTGVEPSTLSEHVAALERALGTRLFERQPFRLNAHGRRLVTAVERARDLVRVACEEISREVRPVLKFVAAEVVTQHFLPGITHELERRHSDLQCSTDSAAEDRMWQLVREGEVDMAIAPEHEGWESLNRERLIELPLVIICPRAWRVRAAAELWRPEMSEVLFVPGSSESLTRSFDAGLRGLHVRWNNRRRVSSLLAVTRQVAGGYGYGLTVDVPNLARIPGLRVLPLPNFRPVPLAAFWRGDATPAHRSAIELMRSIARDLRRARKGSGHAEMRRL